MSTFMKIIVGSVLVGAVLGDDHDEPVCPLYQSTAAKACAWIPSCTVEGCDSKCVANIFGENKLVKSLESVYQSSMMCTLVSTMVTGASFEGDTQSRRLQSATFNMPSIFKTFEASLRPNRVGRNSRRMLDTSEMASDCATSAEIDAAAPALEFLAGLAEAFGGAGTSTMHPAERATMDAIMPLMKDSGKLKDWLSSNCQTATVSGDEMSMYWNSMDMGSGEMPTSITVCKSTSDKVLMLAKEAADVMQSDACGTSDIADYQCLGMDGMLMSEACLNSAAPILSLESTDIAASVSAWTTVHQACVAITDATACQDQAMDVELQRGQAATAAMDEDASATSVSIAGEVSAAHSSVISCMAAIIISVIMMAL